MKLIRFVVVGRLISMNSLMNGFLFGIMEFYGVIDIIIISVKMQNIMICSGMELIVCGRDFFGFLVLVVVVFISLIFMKVNIVIWKLVKKLFSFFGNQLLLFYRWVKEVLILVGDLKCIIIIIRLIMISVMMVIILIIVNQNFILLNILMVVRFRFSSSRIIVSEVIQLESLGNQNCVQVVMVIMFVILVIIQQNQQVQLVKQFVYGFSRLVVKLLKDLYLRFDSSNLFMVCIMKNSIKLIII